MKGLLFTFGLCYGGAIVSLFRPFYGLLIYICFAIIKPDLLWFWSVPQSNYSEIIAIALLVGWAINGFGGFQFGKAKPIVWTLIAFVTWEGLSMMFCENPSAAWWYFDIHLKILIPFVVGVTLIKTTEQVNQLAWTIMLSVGYLAFELNQHYFQGFNWLSGDRKFLGLDNNSFAINLVTAVGLAFFLGFESKKLVPKLVAFASAAFMTHAIMFSFSRGAMVALCLVGVICFVVIPKRPKHFVLFGLGVVLALFMAGPEVRERFSTVFIEEAVRDSSAESRIELWKGCIAMMNDYPLFGVGPNQFKQHVHLYTPYDRGKAAHTTWLSNGAELGYPGFVFLLGFYLIALFCMFRLWRRNRRNIHSSLMTYKPQMVMTSLAGFVVSAMFVSCQLQELSYYVALLAAVTLKCEGSVRRPIRVSPSKMRYRSDSSPTSPQQVVHA